MEDQQDRFSRGHRSDLYIFVAGAPSGVSGSVLISYFRRFGRIEGILSQTGRHLGLHYNTAIVGNFLVAAADSRTYHTILAHNSHRLLGRSLICSQYLSGKALAVKNSEANRRRVILKRVPAELQEPGLRSFLEKHFGKVECIFPFKPESGDAENSPFSRRKYRTFNVMFADRKPAREITQYTYLYIDDSAKIQVEKFRHKNSRKKIALSYQVDRLAEFHPNAELDLDSLQSQVFRKCKSFPFSPNEREVQKSDLDRKQIESANFLVFRSLNTKTIKSMKSRDIICFYQYLFEQAHHCRPVSKVYFLLRHHYKHYLQSFEPTFAEFLDCNQRFNIGKRL